MKLVVFVKRDFRCTDLRCVLAAVLINLLMGMLSCVCGGSVKIYRFLLLPRFAPSPAVFVFVFTCVYLLLGTAFGMQFASCRAKKWRVQTILWYVLLQALLFIWYPLFFGAGLFFLALLDALLILTVSVFLLRAYIKRRLSSAVLLIPCIIWFAFAVILNFCVLLLNA